MLQQRVGDEKRFLSELKQRLLDNFIQEWKATIRGKDGIFHTAVLNLYLNWNNTSLCLQVRLCQPRLGVFQINDNLHRYSAFATEIVPFV